MRNQIASLLQGVLKELGIEGIEPIVEVPSDLSHGDYTSNIALVAAKKIGKNPMELAEEIKKLLATSNWQLAKPEAHSASSGQARSPFGKLRASQKPEAIDRIEVVKPGFINFWLSEEYLGNNLEQVLKYHDNQVLTIKSQKHKILVEFAHPNTHKEFHIGHLRNITLGESICRLLEAVGDRVFRVNYQGDVGLHVAKALYGLLATSDLQLAKPEAHSASSGQAISRKLEALEGKSLKEKAKLLGQAYALGSKAYEEDEATREEIAAINRQIYEQDSAIMPLWEKTRQWSLDYFDSIYKRLGTGFKRLFFESEVYESGRDTVLAHIEDGIFTRDDGAVIFDGEKYGLHKRVFITKDGNATYEAKEIGLAPLQYKEFPFDLAIHIVGPEQAGYFAVVFKALALVDSTFERKEKHIPYGLVQLKEGKMSSRMGQVIGGEWLLDETKAMLASQFSEMSEEVLEMVGLGAVKYSMLKFSLTQNIKFSFEESISLEGNSGPYIQYTYARTRSVLAKSNGISHMAYRKGNNDKQLAISDELELEELTLLRLLHRFPEVVEKAAGEFAPNVLTNYLFELAQAFNLFYQKHKILPSVIPDEQSEIRDSEKKNLDSRLPIKILRNFQGKRGNDEEKKTAITFSKDVSEFRLALTEGVGKTIKHGLYLLGIEAPERM